jgi:hypothetical protein
MSTVLLTPKGTQTQLRWLLLATPLFFLNTVIELAAGSWPLPLVLPMVFVFAMFFCLLPRLTIRDGMICKGALNSRIADLARLVEMTGSTGSHDDDFRDSLVLKFSDGKEFKVFVDEYDEASLRSFIGAVRQAAPQAKFTYSDVISLESRGLLQFLINTMLPDSVIIKLNRSPLAETITELVSTKFKQNWFWPIYAFSWALISCGLFFHRGLVEHQRYVLSGDLFADMALGPTLSLFDLICHQTWLYFSKVDLSVIAMMWTVIGTVGLGIALMRVFASVFVFVDNQTIGLGNRFIPWAAVQSVSLIKTSEFGDPLEGNLVINPDEFNALTISLSQIADPQRKQQLLQLVERYATQAKSNDEFLRATNSLVDINFTDIWLQSNGHESREAPRPEAVSIVGGSLLSGAYSIDSILGYGGQGITYLAHAKLDHGRTAAPAGQVVVKEVVLPNHAEVRIQEDAISKFERGAILLETLNHPQIVKLWDHFTENGRAYLVLEYIQGRTLRDLIGERGVMTPAEAVSIAEQICDILIHLHSQNPAIIHCDLAPDNLIITPGETVKLVDFDVARVLDARRYSFIAGRPSYTPPEQFRGKPSAQSDIYALGAIIHFVMHGTDPSPLGHDECDDHSEPKSAIDELIARCLSFDENDRPASAAALKQELELINATISGEPLGEVLNIKLPEFS